jgi:hypothetical protein
MIRRPYMVEALGYDLRFGHSCNERYAPSTGLLIVSHKQLLVVLHALNHSHHCSRLFPVLHITIKFSLAMILPDDLRRSLEDHNKRARHFQGRADIQVVSNIPQEQWDYKTRNGICAIWYGMSLRVLNSEQARILSETPREYETAYSALESLAPTLNSQFGLAWQARNRTIAETHHRIGVRSSLPAE